MRMWKVDPKLLCDKHLLGEHVEMHMFVGTIQKGKSLAGYIDGGLVETDKINRRHDELVVEMLKRGMNHQSPLPKIKLPRQGTINVSGNLVELSKRCPDCRRRQEDNDLPMFLKKQAY